MNLPYDGDERQFTVAQRNKVVFLNGAIYRHKTLNVNYTTYDLQREQDSLNTDTHADVMILGCEDPNDGVSNPYWYARIIGIFHANVKHIGPESLSTKTRVMNFLWVRWFERHIDWWYHDGWKARKLPCLQFTNPADNDLDAFGFLDPNLVVRAVHIIPAFSYGQTKNLLPSSIIRRPEENDQDWFRYYVNM